MKNVVDLTNELITVYEETKTGTVELPKAKELANIAGKILKATALQLAYNQFMKYANKKIKFLEN